MKSDWQVLQENHWFFTNSKHDEVVLVARPALFQISKPFQTNWTEVVVVWARVKVWWGAGWKHVSIFCLQTPFTTSVSALSLGGKTAEKWVNILQSRFFVKMLSLTNFCYLTFYFPGCDSKLLVLFLDSKNIIKTPSIQLFAKNSIFP